MARLREGASIYPWTDRELTFDGQSEVIIPAGGEVVSDPVLMWVPAQSDLAVSVYLPDPTGPATWHEIGKQTAYISGEGDFAGAANFPAAETTEARYWVSGVDGSVLRETSSVAAFGDSITDGWGSTPDTNQRWPDLLSDRLNGDECHHLGSVGVLNQGISGNRLLNDFMGPNGLDRFERDVLAQSGAKYVVIMLGINDIGFPGAFGIPGQDVTADDIIAGLAQLVDSAHDEGLLAYGGTPAPFEGTTLPGYYTPEGEAARQEVNSWIRTSEVFDAVLDFDAVLRDPNHPTQLLAEYDSGDHLHPSDAGYQAMADAVDLSLFE